MATTKKQIADYITKNAHLFTPGATFTAKRFRQRFNFIVPGLNTANPELTREAALYTSAYTSLNKILAYHGLYMKSVNYHTSFEIIPDTRKKVVDYSNRVKGTQLALTRLQAGIKRSNSNWRATTAAELDHTSPLIVSHTPSY